MTRMMKAAVVRSFKQPLDVCEVPMPTPGPGQVVVRVMACGCCHTDLHAAHGDWPVKPVLPLIPGHEGVGLVSAVGADVRDLREGDAVGVPWLHDACGVCEYCTSGWETLCGRQHATGYSVNGAYAEYVLADAKYVGKLPPDTDFVKMAPVLCAGVTTYKGLKETEAKPGEWVAISGIGGLGHVAIQYAKAMGFHVAALDIADDKLALARRLGAEVAVKADEEGASEAVRKATAGGAHGVLVTAVSRAAFAQALQLVRPKGTVSLVGLPPGDFPTPIFDVVLKRITIRGSIVGTRKDLTEAIDFAVAGAVVPIVAPEPLDNVNQVFQRMLDGQIDGRVAFVP